jgi:hypothetical protein
VTGDGVVTGDLIINAQSAMIIGDMSLSMEAVVDDGIDFLDY